METSEENGESQKQELMTELEVIRKMYGWASATALARIISHYACERQVINLLKTDYVELTRCTRRFDKYYRQKSEFATIKIIESLKTKLSSDGLKATILTEVPSNTIGRYDIVVVPESPNKAHYGNEKRIRIEVKASSGLDLEQINRYLWDPSPLILVRVRTGHVAKIEPARLRSYVLFSQRELSKKMERLLTGKFYTIPGPACTLCLDRSCSFNRSTSRESINTVIMSNDEFSEDLNLFFENLRFVAEKTANMTVEELKRFALKPPQAPSAFVQANNS